jgi:hypothetical protein
MRRNDLLRAVATAAIAAAAACGTDASLEPIVDPSRTSALITVVFPARPQDTLNVLVSDSAAIARANAFVSTGSGPRMITGTIVRGAGADARYPFHYRPASVAFADAGMEICDGALMRTTKDVDDFFTWNTGSASSNEATWCPWGSKPIAVVMVPNP